MFEQPVVANRAMLKFVEILSKFVEICRICRSQLFFEFLAKIHPTIRHTPVASTPRHFYLSSIQNQHSFGSTQHRVV